MGKKLKQAFKSIRFQVFLVLAIQQAGSDEYSLTKFRVYNHIRLNYASLSILDSVYLYDSRNQYLLMVPDDTDKYEEVVRGFFKEEKEGPDTSWLLLKNGETYTLSLNRKISDKLWILGFLKIEKIAQEFRSLAENNAFQWEITSETGELLYGNRGGETGKQYFEIENPSNKLHMNFRFWVSENSIREQNLMFTMMFLLGIVLFFAAAIVISGLLNRSLLRPLNHLIEGMMDFAGGNEEASLKIEGSANQELKHAMATFNRMVHQIRTNRFLIDKGKLERQKLYIINLQSQVNPHFFSNTMNLIYNLVATNRGDAAKKAVLLLSSYYRYMTRIGQQSIALRKEFDFIRDYLEIMKLRYPRQLEYSLSIDEDMEKFLLPPMLIQPLVENSIKHGFVHREREFHIAVEAYRAEGKAGILVEDSGVGFPEEYRGTFDKERLLPEHDSTESDVQVGLQNIYQRLMMFYGENCRMVIGWDGQKTRILLEIEQ